MCIRYSHHDLVFSIIEMEESIASAALLADRLENYVFKITDAYSEDRVLRELNNINRKIAEASNQNAKLRKEINHAKHQAGTESQGHGYGGLPE